MKLKLRRSPTRDLFLLFTLIAAIWTAAWIKISAQEKVREIKNPATVRPFSYTF